MICSNCGAENRPGRRFCSQCGETLSVVCGNCGAANDPGDRFCGECGSSLEAGGEAGRPSVSEPAAERRLITVLFADLVGFTPLSERRDPEEVRDLLSGYFEQCRRLIGRYGGTVEKFIGDAVMAVWGTPTAQEDDAERAVRAGLELAAAVSALGAEVEADLQARVGILTGEAAVTLGAEGQGMVAGDLVNTASRIQSVAPPGGVLVGDTTRRTTEAAIAYEEAGAHELKGKEEPMALWRALRVVGGRKGALRTTGLEAPFVGREREMRLIKELFHASADEGKAHLVSVMGVAGVGKTRVSWEFEKYIDGLADVVWWHRGRCLAYGEGVAYWALAEMVRSRAGIVEGEEPEAALSKLRAAIDELIPDPEERGWVEPRLAHLLGLEERTARDQADLFSAWRLFFERMAEQAPVEMIFEDLQWADTAMLDFIEYLMEWSKDHPLFILTLARPEIADRRPSWGAVSRNFTSLSLEPLSASDMEELMQGLVPGLPVELQARLLERAEGIPLYAVETVRMLLDRGLVERIGEEYHATGPVEDLEVPESLHGLIAARLDGLMPEERRLLQDASVLGKTFTKQSLGSVSRLADDQLERLLSSMVRKELMSVQADPRSPERGQYGFLQDLVRRVAYETLSKKERRARHLAVAEHFDRSWGGDEEEIVEVVASHLVEAYQAAPEASDAGEIKARARAALLRAGDRAAALAAHEEAQRYFEQAAELEDDPVSRAELLERAGSAARASGAVDIASERYEEALTLFERHGLSHPVARIAAKLGEVMWDRGRAREGLERMDRAFRVLSDEEPDEALASLAAELGRFLFFSGQPDQALERIERALDIAESLWLPEVLSNALNTKAVILYSAHGRRREGFALLKYALEIALEYDVQSAALRAYYNIIDLTQQSDRMTEAQGYLDAGLALARRIGNRYWEWQLLGQIYPSYITGDWDRAVEMTAQLPPEKVLEARGAFLHFLNALPRIHVFRGELEAARVAFESFPAAATSDDIQERSAYAVGLAFLLRADGEPTEALESALAAFEARHEAGLGSENVKEGFLEAVEAAFELSDLTRVEDLLGIVEQAPSGKRPQYLEMHAVRLRARLKLARGEEEVEPGFKLAAGGFRELGTPFWMAVTLLEHGEWLVGEGRSEEAAPLLAEAGEVFDRLRARPWLERVTAASQAVVLPQRP
jgi:class 3 adenylate cyclase/tetratricopeptide (TPR) repeat protein